MSDKRSAAAIARRNAKKREQRAAKRNAILASLKRPMSKTSPEYRRRFIVPDQMDKPDLRKFLAQAVQNTVSQPC